MSITNQDDFDNVGQSETMLCDHCDKYRSPKDCGADEYGEVICQSCRENRDEAAYERQQEKAFTDYWEGEGTSAQVKLDQELKDAGRGHLASDLHDIAVISDERRNK